MPFRFKPVEPLSPKDRAESEETQRLLNTILDKAQLRDIVTTAYHEWYDAQTSTVTPNLIDIMTDRIWSLFTQTKQIKAPVVFVDPPKHYDT